MPGPIQERERLQKYIAECGVCSRRAAEKLIQDGLVSVNGMVAHIGDSVDPRKDKVLVEGKPVRKEKVRRVILFYKPRGVVSTSNDPEGRKTVQSYFKEIPERLYNVGRLDLNSEGLLLMTNDGALANRLTHPRYGVEKKYFAVCDGDLTPEQADMLKKGVMLDDGMTAPAKLSNVKHNVKGDSTFYITIHEGRNRQIRRMLEAVGHRTLRLKREQFGPFILGPLRAGQWRELTERELKELDQMLAKPADRKGTESGERE
ncbi:MAG: pseudouridine synthase [Clostridia bacterium]|nr:pseudouridine synthase [Clostridia bacterium]